MKIDFRDKLVTHSLVMVLSMGLSIALNIVFQAVVGRSLSPDEFGVLASLLAVVQMTHMPMSAVSSGITRFVALEVQRHRAHAVRKLFVRWTLKLGALYAPVLAVGVLCAEPIAAFFHLDRLAPVIVMSLVVGGILGTALVNGILHGLQEFNWLLYTNLAMSVVRVVAAASFIYLITPGAGWALLGHGTGLFALVLLGVVAIHLTTGRPTSQGPAGRAYLTGYVVKSACVLGAYAVMMQGDIIVVRHYLPLESGVFSYASTLGKIMILVCVPIAKSLFPKVVSAGSASAEHIHIMRKAILYSGGVAVFIALGCTLLPGIPLRLLYKMDAPDLQARMLVAAMAWTMVPVGLINLVIYFQMAQQRFRELAPVYVGVAAYAACILVWHESVWHIVGALFVTSSCTLAGLLRSLPQSAGESDPEAASP